MDTKINGYLASTINQSKRDSKGDNHCNNNNTDDVRQSHIYGERVFCSVHVY